MTLKRSICILIICYFEIGGTSPLDFLNLSLDENNYPTVKATDATEDFVSNLSYTDFTLTFEPFETTPETFNFKEGDGKGAFVIRNVALK